MSHIASWHAHYGIYKYNCCRRKKGVSATLTVGVTNGRMQGVETARPLDPICNLSFGLLRLVESSVHVHCLEVLAMFTNEGQEPYCF